MFKIKQKHNTTFRFFSNYVSCHATFVSGFDICLFQMEV